MELRPAVRGDLPRLRAVYGAIIENMEANHIRIWDEFYPCALFGGDIENQRLYVLTQGEEIISAFALCGPDQGDDQVRWKSGDKNALYLQRFGVSAAHQGKGYGSAALREAIALAGKRGAEYLRLFVVDVNAPAIRFYGKNGFTRADGVRREDIGGGTVLREYGFEIRTNM